MATSGTSDGDEFGPRGRQVLLVEDDETVRELCERTLTAEGYVVIPAASGEEALERWTNDNTHDPGVTILEAAPLVITDVVLPGMDGATLARTLRGRLLDLDGQTPLQSRTSDDTDAGGGTGTGSLPVLLISGHDPADLGIDTDEFAFLAKPFTPEQLVAATRGICEWEPLMIKGRSQGASEPTDDPGDAHDGPSAKDRPRLVGFGTFTTGKRLAATAATAGIAVLAAAALVLTGSDDDVELVGDDAGDVEIEEAATSDEDQAQSGDGNDQAGVVSGDDNQQDQTQSGDGNDQAGIVPGDDNHQDQTQSGDASDQAGVVSEPDSDPDPIVETVAYEPPDVGDPVLDSCTASRTDDGTTEYAVTYTVTTTGGAYDVLPGEPFLGNDQRLEIRGDELTWTIGTVHIRERGDDADPFHVAPPDVLGWAEPGGEVRQHAHQPPPLAVHHDQCRTS